MCGEVGILDKMRIAYTISALSGIYTVFLHTHQLEWGEERMALGRWD